MTQDVKIKTITKFGETICIILTILSTVCGALIWMNGKFNDIDKRFSEVEKDIAIIKTVMIMKNILPSELAKEQ